jgi:hypothetical protein
MAGNLLPKTSTIICCNPRNKEKQKITSLRPATAGCVIHHIIEKGMKICDACRKQLKVQKVIDEQELSVPVAAKTSIAGRRGKDEEFVDLDVSLEYLNKSFVTVEQSPVAKKS